MRPKLILALIPLTLAAQEYSGKWQSQKDSGTELTVEKTGDTVHVTELHGAKVKADYTCKLGGTECVFHDEGHKAKIALWMNGPYLVEMRTRGETVTKRRMMLKDDKTLQLEVMPVFPKGKTDIILFSRK